MSYLRFCCGILVVVCCLSYIAAEEQAAPKPDAAPPKSNEPADQANVSVFESESEKQANLSVESLKTGAQKDQDGQTIADDKPAEPPKNGESKDQPDKAKAENKPAEPKTEGEKKAKSDVFELGTVTVTVPPPKKEDKKAASRQDAIAICGTTITPALMQDENTNTVSKAASLAPGVSFDRIGPRNEEQVFVHGFDPRQVPLFIDGVPVSVPYDGYVDFGLFNVFDVSEVRVDKGFTSVLYGPNTLGGAVNVVTKRPTEKLEGSAGTGITLDRRGQFSNQFEYFNVGSNQGKFYYQGSVSFMNQDFFTPAWNNGPRDNSDVKDGHVLQRFGYTPNDTDEYSFTYSLQLADKGVPPYTGDAAGVMKRYWRYTLWENQNFYFISRTQISEALQLKTRFYYDLYPNTLKSYDDDTYSSETKKYAFTSIYKDYSYGGSLELGYDVTPVSTLKGAILFKDDVHQEHEADGKEPHLKDQDRTWSFALEYTHRVLEQLDVTGGVRYDFRETPGAQDGNTGAVAPFPTHDVEAWNGQVGAIYHVLEASSLFGTFSQTSRLPTLKDRYSYRLGTAIPDPELHAETSDNYQLGFRGQPQEQLQVETSVFYHDIHDLIQSVTLTPKLSQEQNIAHARHMGWETGLTWHALKPVDFGVTYTLLECDDLTDPSIRLTDIPKNKFHAFASWRPIKKFEFRPSLDFESGRETTTTGLQKTTGFIKGDIMARYEVRKGFNIQVGVDNVGNTRYEYEEGYPEPGRTFYTRLSFKF